MGRVKGWYMMDDSTEPEFNCYNCNPDDCLNYQARCYECEDYHGPNRKSNESPNDELGEE